MQELEKILEEIENERTDIDDYSDAKGRMLARHWNSCIDVVEEIIRNHMNGGWIPCSERMPTKEECENDNNEFLVQTDTGERFSCEYDPLANGFDNPLWCCNVPVVAWMPLPEPYRPERSEGE